MLEERIETWIEEATCKGMQQGIQQGRIDGARRLLAKQLERRFGPLPPSDAEWLAGASEAQIEAWSEAVLFSLSQEAVFGQGMP